MSKSSRPKGARWGKSSLQRLRVVSLLLGILMLAEVPSRAADPGMDIGPDVYNLFTANIPPYVGPGPDGAIVGTLVPRVEEFLKARGLKYRMSMLPWSAAYRRAAGHPHALIFPLDRTPAREDQFHWLLPLVTTSYYLYGLRDQVDPNVTIADIAAQGSLVSCTRNSIQCALLLQNGLPNENILRIEGASITRRFNLLTQERNFYTVFDPLVLKRLAKRDQLDVNMLVQIRKVGDMTSYLAANINLPATAYYRLTAE